MLNKAILTIAFWLLAASVSTAQELAQTTGGGNFPAPPVAQKLDEFGPVGHCDMGARFDGFLSALMERMDATGYVVVYQSTNALPSEYEISGRERALRNHLMFRNFDASRVVFIKGGFRAQVGTELWLVPSGAAPPAPTETVPAPRVPTEKTFLYGAGILSGVEEEEDYTEAFVLPSVKAQREAEQRQYELENRSEETEPENSSEEETTEETPVVEIAETRSPEEIEDAKYFWILESFGELVRKHEGAGGVIVFYADDQIYDLGQVRNHIEEGSRRLAAKAKISPGAIKVVYGGYRGSITTEFWFVPKKGEMPKPTPEDRPVETAETET